MTTKLNGYGVVGKGLLRHRAGKAEGAKGWVLHLHVCQYGVVAHGVCVAPLVVDLKEEQRACGGVKLGNLAK